MTQKPDKQPKAYFIHRQSHIDGSTWFNDQGRRVYFDKAVHARQMLPNMDADQKPKVLYGPIQDGDIPFRQFLEEVALADTGVTPEQYLAAVEEAARNAPVSQRAARSFLRRMKRMHAPAAG